MFMPQSDQPSDAEIKLGEEEATTGVRNFAVGCLALYFAPHAIAYFMKML